MRWTELQTYQPVLHAALDESEERRLGQTCPFGEEALDENQLAASLFPDAKFHPMLGRKMGCFAGVVQEGDYQERGSSGGMGTWIAVEMLRVGMVTAIVHVGETGEGKAKAAIFGYRISRTVEEIRENSKSRYYPIQISTVLAEIKASSSTEVFAFFGIPCMVKSVRLACHQDPLLARKIPYCVGLVCGHLKSGGFAELLAWQVGVAPDELQSINFREKLPGKKSNTYGFRVVGKRDGKTASVVSSMSDVRGGDWGQGLFKLKACEFCDDVVGETADIVIGDAWLPAYTNDHKGTNLVIVRNSVFREMLRNGVATGRLRLDDLSDSDAVKSQASGFRHRREGLAYRLARAAESKVWFPPKRTKPSDAGLGKKREKIYQLRYDLSLESHAAFLAAKKENRLEVFFDRLQLLLSEYVALTRPTKTRRAASKLKHLVFRLLGR